MGFDDIFKQDHDKRAHYNRDHHYKQEHYSRNHESHGHEEDHFDLLKGGHDRAYRGSDHNYGGHSQPGHIYGSAFGGGHFNLQDLLVKLKENRKLRVLFSVAAVVVVMIALTLVILFFPLLIKLVNYLSQAGLQGVINDITSVVDKIWKGAGK
jgi:hypothetical protein